MAGSTFDWVGYHVYCGMVLMVPLTRLEFGTFTTDLTSDI